MNEHDIEIWRGRVEGRLESVEDDMKDSRSDIKQALAIITDLRLRVETMAVKTGLVCGVSAMIGSAAAGGIVLALLKTILKP